MAREIDLGSIVGPQGPKGEKGETGAQGPAGPKGEKGDTGATTAGGVSYKDTDVEKALDDLTKRMDDVQYVKIQISSFTNNVNTVEMGSTVNTVVLSWATNKTPKTLTLDGAALDVSLKTKTIENANIKANKTYTLKATDDREAEATKTSLIQFLNGVYYGAAANASAFDSAFVLKLTKALQSSKAKTFTVTASPGQHIYYAIPARYGTPTFKVGGFDGGFTKAVTIDFTNASGHKESYDIWKSDNAGLGNTTVVVA